MRGGGVIVTATVCAGLSAMLFSGGETGTVVVQPGQQAPAQQPGQGITGADPGLLPGSAAQQPVTPQLPQQGTQQPGQQAPAQRLAPPQPSGQPTLQRQAQSSAEACIAAASVQQLGLTSEQLAIARKGLAAAERAGTGQRGADIIIATGLVESGLRNLTYGDRDSLGWLQQRPSQGWGNATDADKAADDFFAAMKDLVPDWDTRPKGEVAQLVQRSAFPGRYTQRMGEAERIVATLTGARCAATTRPLTQPGGSRATTPGSSAGVLSDAAETAHAWAMTKNGNDYVFGGNGPNSYDCSSFVMTAYSQSGITMPRTAEAQRQWCAKGNCAKVTPGQETKGDLIFWDSYLGPSQAGHVVMVHDPARKETIEARSTKEGIGVFSYANQQKTKNIFDIYRVKGK